MKTQASFSCTSACVKMTALIAILAISPATADAAITLRIVESSSGSGSVVSGVGGRVSLGVFASSNETNVTTFDSFDIYIDVGGDGKNVVDPQFIFPASPVIAGPVFTNAERNPANDATTPVADADLHVSADRGPFTFTSSETKLFDFVFDVTPTASVGNYAVAFRDDSGFLAAINAGGDNLLQSSPEQFTLTPGSFSVTAVPEPSSLLLFGTILSSVVLNRRRKHEHLSVD